MAEVGTLDLRRKAQISRGKPTDHAADVIVRPSRTFDLGKTIFRNLDSTIARLATKDRMGIEVFWSDEVARKIEADFQALPEAPKHDQALLDFMKNDCDFASLAHFKNRPPRVLFLHSIMGVGTNYFPMQVEKLPKLQALLSEEDWPMDVLDSEFKHIEAFPSILRLLINFDLVQEFLDAGPAKVAENFDGIKFHRVIDNKSLDKFYPAKKLSLDADSFWVHLNYQLIHLMDFLPIADWQARMDDTYMDLFLVLFEFMKDAGKLQAHVDLDLGPVENPTGNSTPTTLVGFLMNRVVPSSLKRRVRKKEIVKYSTEVGPDPGDDCQTPGY
eukprot:g20935.t1